MHLVHLRYIISGNPKDLTKQRIRRWTMTTQESIRLFENYLNSNHKQHTIDSYGPMLSRFELIYSQRALDSIGVDSHNKLAKMF